MSTEENKAVVRRFIAEVVNGNNLSAVDELFAPNYVLYMSHSPEPSRGTENVKHVAAMFRSAFPDWHNTIEDMLADGEKVVTRWTERGTHQGEFQGIAPTGKQVTLTGIDIYRISDGMIAEQWVQADMLGFMQQLGVVPPPG